LSTSLPGKLRALWHAYKEDIHNAERANLIATLEMDALSIAQRLDKDIIANTLGEADIDSIRRLVRNADEGMEENLQHIHFYLMKKEIELQKEWSKRKSKQMQDLYMDDAK
jgi:hypothetical protein